MAELLKQYVKSEGVQIDERLPLEKSLSDGVVMLQLLRARNVTSETAGSDAQVNMQKLHRILVYSLGLNFTSRTASSIMQRHQGVAAQVLLSIKTALEQAQSGSYESQYDSLSRGSRADRATHRRVSSAAFSRGLQRASLTDVTSDQGMINTIGACGKTTELERASTLRFKQRGAALEQSARAHEQYKQEAERERVAAFREERLNSLRTRQAAREQAQHEQQLAHARTIERSREAEQMDLRAELAVAEKKRRQKEIAQQHAAQDAIEGVEEFEQNLRAIGISDEQGDQSASGSVQLNQQQSHPQVLTGMSKEDTLYALSSTLPSLSSDTFSATEKQSKHLSGFESRHSKRESARRRARQALANIEARAEEEDETDRIQAVDDAIERESEEERRLAGELARVRREEEAVRERRLERQQEEHDRRELEWQRAIEAEKMALARERAEYEVASAETAHYRKLRKQKEESERMKSVNEECHNTVHAIIDLAASCANWRSQSELMVPRREWSDWVATFVAYDCAHDRKLHQAHRDHDELQNCISAPDERALREYLARSGEWSLQQTSDSNGQNHALAYALCDLVYASARLNKQASCNPVFKDADLKIALIGTPFSGHRAAAAYLCNSLGLQLVEPRTVVEQAVRKVNSTNSDGNDTQAAEGNREVQAGAEIQEARRSGVEPSASSIAKAIAEAIKRAAAGIPVVEPFSDDSSSKSGSKKKGSTQAQSVASNRDKSGQSGRPGSSSKRKSSGKQRRSQATDAEHDDEQYTGVILLDFPRDEVEAEALESELTGLDLESQRRARARSSIVAPPPPEREKLLHTQALVSGLDRVLIAQPSDQTELKRAMGRRVDPHTGREFHIEYAPPPDNEPGLASRLIEPEDDEFLQSNVHMQLDQTISRLNALRRWLGKFESLVHDLPNEESTTPMEVCDVACKHAVEISKSNSAAQSAVVAADAAQRAQQDAARARERANERSHEAEKLADEMIRLKKAADDAKDSSKSQASADTIGAQSEKQIAAEQAKWEEEKSKANEAAEEAEHYAAEARVKADSAMERANAIDTPAVAAREAQTASLKAKAARERVDKSTEEENKTTEEGHQHQKQQEEQEANKPADGVHWLQNLDGHEADKLLAGWEKAMEQGYVEGLKLAFSRIRRGREEISDHYGTIKCQLASTMRSGWCETWNDMQDTVDKLNKVEQSAARKNDQIKGELLLNVEEARDLLWDKCDSRLGSWNKLVSAEEESSFLTAALTRSSSLFAHIVQLELDRHMATVSLLRCHAALVRRAEQKQNEFREATEEHMHEQDTGQSAEPDEQTIVQFAPAKADVNTWATIDKHAPQWILDAKDVVPEAASAVSSARAQRIQPEKSDPDGVAREVDAFDERLLAILSVATSHAQEAKELSRRAIVQLRDAAKARHHAECSAVAAAAMELRTAVENESPIRASLAFVPDASLLVDHAHPALPEPNPPDDLMPHGSKARARHVYAAGTALRSSSSEPWMPTTPSRAASALSSGATFDGGTGLPSALAEASVTELEALCQNLCPRSGAQLLWPSVLAIVASLAEPAIVTADVGDVVNAKQALASADTDNDGYLSRSEWKSCALWFTEKAPEVHSALFDSLCSAAGYLHWFNTLINVLALGTSNASAVHKALAVCDGDIVMCCGGESIIKRESIVSQVLRNNAVYPDSQLDDRARAELYASLSWRNVNNALDIVRRAVHPAQTQRQPQQRHPASSSLTSVDEAHPGVESENHEDEKEDGDEEEAPAAASIAAEQDQVEERPWSAGATDAMLGDEDATVRSIAETQPGNTPIFSNSLPKVPTPVYT